jgi:hypothetical protein
MPTAYRLGFSLWSSGKRNPARLRPDDAANGPHGMLQLFTRL